MQFAVRLIVSTVVVAIVLVVLCACLLFLAWLINRGLQLFLGLFGYEVGDLFQYLAKRLKIKRKTKTPPK